jgi:hypothetical protein
MGGISVVQKVWSGLRQDFGTRIGRSLRDGCIAMTVFVVSAYGITDQTPTAALSALASLTGADLSDVAAEAMVRTQLFGGHVLQGMETAKLIVFASFLIRTAISAFRALRASGENAHA